MPWQLRPDLPEAAEGAILKALSLNPADRFRSAREFGDALGHALAPGLISKPSTPAGTPWKRLRPARHRFRVRRVIAAASVLMAVAVLGLLWVRPKPPAPDFVAVLPFENRTGDPGLAYLSEN
jgi:hypothetical protein